MVQCQNQLGSRHAFPRDSSSVADRRFSLDIPCREDATCSCKLKGTVGGRERKGAPVREFFLCTNHAQLFTQVDSELKQELWSTAFEGPYVQLT